MIMFKINKKDYSSNVLADSYVMSRQDVYKAWEDGNGVENRQVVRKRVSGSFSMFFKDMSEYENFLADLEASIDKNTNAITCTVTLNYPTNEEVSILAFYSFEPVRIRDWKWQDAIQKFVVNIRER